MLLESVPSIENNFWSSDKTALNILLEKLDHSDKSTIAIQDYFAQRTRIEEEYGNQLLKLSETLNDTMQQHDEEAENFNIISNTTEMSARAHIDLSQNIRNLLELPLNDFVNDQENIKAFMTNQMKESQNLKMLHGDNVKKARELYINECQKVNPSYKDIDMLDFEYQKAIHSMQANSHAWIHDWRESCKTFQSLEINRLEYLKAVIKTFSSMTACTCSIDDQTCERLSNVMDDINGNAEIAKFIANHGTGSTLPEIPKYTKYRGGGGSNRESSSTYSGGDMGSEYTRTIKEINIPIKHDEELRSVNDQLKKIPSPWDNAGNTKPKMNKAQNTYPPPTQQQQQQQQYLQYPLNPVYKSNRQNPSQSDPILSNYTFNQDDVKIATKNKSTLVIPLEEKKYHPTQNKYNKQQQPQPTTTSTTATTATAPHKKSSILFSTLGFLKKKKNAAATIPPQAEEPTKRKKRLSLGHLSISHHNNTKTMMLPNTSSTVLTPPSPMFSQMDFYYSPSPSSDHHHHSQQQKDELLQPQSPHHQATTQQ